MEDGLLTSAGERVLVTGGAGFIGSHLVDRLLREGFRVRVVDNFSTGRRGNLSAAGDDVELVEGDLRSYERAHRAVHGCDYVLHQAAMPSVPRSVQDPLTSTDVNVTGTLNVLLASRDAGIRRVVCASSSSVYGPGETLPKAEDQRPQPISPYAVAKLAGEGFCRSFHEVYGLDTVSLRYFNVFGPRQDPSSQYAAVLPNFITSVLEGTRPTIFGDGTQSRDFTYIDNVVDANLVALEAPAPVGDVLNVACGERISLKDVVDVLAEISGTAIEPIYADPRPGDILHSLADITRAREQMGWQPLVSFREGLQRTFASFVPADAARAQPA